MTAVQEIGTVVPVLVHRPTIRSVFSIVLVVYRYCIGTGSIDLIPITLYRILYICISCTLGSVHVLHAYGNLFGK